MADKIIDDNTQNPKNKIQEALYDFDATIKANPNLSDKELLSKFPEFGNDTKKLQAAKDYSATLSSGKYKSVDEFNNKFPEFFDDIKKKEVSAVESSKELLTPFPSSSQLPSKEEKFKEQSLKSALMGEKPYIEPTVEKEQIEKRGSKPPNIFQSIEDEVKKTVELKSAGYKKNGKLIYDTPSEINKIRDNIQKGLDNGTLVYKDGKIVTGLNAWESLTKGIDNANQKELQDKYVVSLSKNDAINYLNNKIQHPEIYQKSEEAPSNSLAELTSNIGENLGFIGKMVTGGIAGTALAPETGGASFGQFLSTVKDMAYSGYAETLEENYKKLKEQNLSITDGEAYDKAHNAALVGEALQIGVAGVFASGSLPKILKADKVKLPIPTKEPNGVVEGVSKSLLHTAKEYGKISAATVGATAGTELASKINNVDVTWKDFLDKTGEQLKGNGAALFGLWALTEPFKIPSYIRPQIENYIASAPRKDVSDFYNKLEQEGIIPKGKADEIITHLDNFENIGKNIPKGLSEESEASLKGILLKKENIQKEIDELHKYGSTFQDAIDAKELELKEWDNQASKIYNTNKPFEGAKDVLGKDISLEPKDEKQVKKQPIPEEKKTLTTEQLMPTIEVNGKQYSAENHGEAMDKAREDLKQQGKTDEEIDKLVPDWKTKEGEKWREQNGGFIDNTEKGNGEFITRNEADERHGVTRSEDLIKPEMEVEKEKVTPTEKVGSGVDVNPLADVESSHKAISELPEDEFKNLQSKVGNFDAKTIAEKYHLYKGLGTNPFLVKAVEDAIYPKKDLSLQYQNNDNAELEKQLPNTLSPTEKQGSLAGGEANATATAITGAIHKAVEEIGTGGKKLSPDQIRQKEETELKKYAKDNGLLIENNFGEPDNFGNEQDVFVNKDGKTVTKINDNPTHDTWNDFFHKIAIHNSLFPDVAYTLKGFSERDGHFAAVLEQPLITKGEEPVKYSDVKDELSKMGFEPSKDPKDFSSSEDYKNKQSDNVFVNKKTSVKISDLHGENVIKGTDGKIHFIDPLITIDKNREIPQEQSLPTQEVKPPKPPQTPEIKEQLLHGDIDGTPIKMKLITDAKEYFRKIGVSWDKRAESAMESLSYYATINNFNSLYDAALSKVNEWYDKVQKGGFNANSEEVIQMGYFRHATERMMKEQSVRMESSIESEMYNAINEFGNLSKNLEKIDAVIGGSGSEAGAAFGLRQGLFKTDSDVSLGIVKGKVMGVVNPIVNEIIKEENAKSNPDKEKIKKAQKLKLQAEADIEKIHKEQQDIKSKIDEKTQQDADKRFEQRVKEEVEKRLKEAKEKPRKGKLTVEQAKKIEDKLKKIADNVENFLKAKGIEGAEIQGVSFQKALADAIRYIADRIGKRDIPELIEQAIKMFVKDDVTEIELRNNINKALIESGIDEKDLKSEQIVRLEKELEDLKRGIVKEINRNRVPTEEEKRLKEQIFEEKKKLGLISPKIKEIPTYNYGLEITPIEQIKEIAQNEEADNITKSMVSKGLIKDLINTYLDEGIEPKNVIDKATKELKELFPNIERSNVRDAYMKEGMYKLDDLNTLNKERTQLSNELKNIEDLSKKLEQLKKDNIAYQAKNNKPSPQIEKESTKIRQQLDKELIKQGIKKEFGSSEQKASNKELAISHNERVKNLSNMIVDMLNEKDISEGKKEALNKIKKVLDESEISEQKLNSIQDKESLLNKALMKIDVLLRDRKFKDLVREEKLRDVKKMLDDLISESEKEKEKSEFQLNLDKTIKNKKSRIKNIQTKISLGEYDKEPARIKPRNAEIIQLEQEERLLNKEYNKIQNKIINDNKNVFQKVLDAAQVWYLSDLISNWTTTAAVAASGVTKPVLETTTRGIGSLELKAIEKIPILNKMFSNLTLGAGSEGAYKNFIAQEKARYKSILGNMNVQEVQESLNKSVEVLNEANDKYQKNLEKANQLKETLTLGEDSKEYKVFVHDVLSPSLNESNKALYESFIPAIQMFIGGSSLEDAAKIMVKGASQLEESMGFKTVENFRELSNIDKALFLLGIVGRSHSVLKNFSARGEFAAGFMSRLENKIRLGEDVSNTSVLLEVADDAMNDYNRGKYQNSNFLSSVANSLKKGAEDLAKKYPNNPIWGTSAKGFRALLNADFPIAKTGLNILDEGITEYWFGVYKGAIMQLSAEYKGAGGYKGILDVVKGDKSLQEVREQMGEYVKKLPPEYKDMILRAYRKGSFRYLLKALGLLGWIAYGGSQTPTSPKKKKEGEEGYEKLPLNDQLDYGQLQLGKWKMSKEVSHIFTHASVLYGFLSEIDYARIKEAELSKGKTDKEASGKALISSLNSVIDKVPYSKEINPFAGGKMPNISIPVPLGALTKQIQGEDKKGTDWWENTKLKIPFAASDVGYKEGVSQIKNVDKYYDAKRKEMRERGALDEDIVEINKRQENLIKELKKAKTKEEAQSIIDEMKNQ